MSSSLAMPERRSHCSGRTIPAFMLRGFFDELERRGVSRADLARAGGFELPRSDDMMSSVSEAVMHRLFETASALTADETIGLAVGRAMDPASFHLVGHLAIASTNLASAVELAVRAVPNLTRRRLLLEAVGAEQLRLGFLAGECSLCPGARIEAEMTAILLQKLARLFFADGSSFQPHVDFPHAAPAYELAYREYFPGGFGFESDGTFLTFPKSVLVRRRSGADLALVQQIFKLTQVQFDATVQDDDWTSRVRRVLMAKPALRLVQRTALAAQLGVSSRGLTRRLAREGTCLSELIADVLYERAQDLLRRPRATSTQVADELGYAEVSSFFRAFRRWSGGVTPAEFVRGIQVSATRR